MNESIENEMGYAKIEGPNIHKLITKTKVYLGREVESKDPAITDDIQFISLGHGLRVSRKHVFIYFDYDKHEWYAQNHSKNKIYINKEVISKLQDPICISPMAAFQVDENNFYFFQSKAEN